MVSTSPASSLPRILYTAISRRFGKIPSKAFLAKEFNLHSTSSHTVSQESIRRWLTGASKPEYAHLQTLINWLDIDANDIFPRSEHTRAQERHLRPQSWQLLPELENWGKKLRCLNPQQRVPLMELVDQLLSLRPVRSEKTYTSFSDLVSSTRAATAGLGQSENILHRSVSSIATF